MEIFEGDSLKEGAGYPRKGQQAATGDLCLWGLLRGSAGADSPPGDRAEEPRQQRHGA